MNSEEIKEEARKRIERMSLEEKMEMMGYGPESEELFAKAKELGFKSLTKEQQQKFITHIYEHDKQEWVGGVGQAADERELEEEFGITRDDIKNMKKNPYKAGLLRDIIISLVLHTGTAVVAAVGMGSIAPVFEVPAGLVAMDFAGRLMKYFKYKKMQKNYVSGKFIEEEITSEMYKQLHEEYRKGMLK